MIGIDEKYLMLCHKKPEGLWNRPPVKFGFDVKCELSFCAVDSFLYTLNSEGKRS